jgi:hypothetical protein
MGQGATEMLMLQPCSETSSVFIIRPTAQRYGGLVIIFGLLVSGGEVGRRGPRHVGQRLVRHFGRVMLPRRPRCPRIIMVISHIMVVAPGMNPMRTVSWACVQVTAASC